MPVLLFEDASCVVVAKPSGLLVHNAAFAGPREVTALDLARARLDPTLVPVHRLDRGTSGVLLLARGGASAQRWQAALAGDDADKRYVALARGVLREAQRVDHAFADEGGVRREAVTELRPLLTRDTPRCTLICARPRTGRTHQVRRHLKHLSHPVIGDANYGKGPLNREYARDYGLARLALHAWSLTLRHPDDGRLVTWHATLPEDLAAPLRAIFGGALDEALRSERCGALPSAPPSP